MGQGTGVGTANRPRGLPPVPGPPSARMVAGAFAPTICGSCNVRQRPLRRRLLALFILLRKAAAAETFPTEDAFSVETAAPPHLHSGDDTADGVLAAVDNLTLQAAPSRRLPTAVGVKFETGPVVNNKNQASNFGEIAPDAININVRAGVEYPTFNILATGGGLGVDDDLVRVKLVPEDLKATMRTCDETESLMGAPFDGLSKPPRVRPDPEDIKNEFVEVVFPRAGLYRLCYSGDSVRWQLLEPTITVYGADFSNNKFWCAMDLIGAAQCKQGTKDSLGCHCQGKLEGVKRLSEPLGKLRPLGKNNIPNPQWKITLTIMQECGQQIQSVFTNVPSVVSYGLGYEVHNFGNPVADVATLGSWMLCYCPGFDWNGGIDGIDQTCFGSSPEDFPQSIGKLTTIDVVAMYPTDTRPIVVHPTLRFSLEVQCGATAQTTGAGGCVSTDASRYKIIPRSAEADLPYFDSNSGCQFMPQAESTSDGTIVVGGQIAPVNCAGPSLCEDKPEKLGPKIPTWDNVQIDGSYNNNVMVPASYDVCYCDEDCTNSVYWFKAGRIDVMPVTMNFYKSWGDTVKLLERDPVLATPYYVVLEGPADSSGGWTLDPAPTTTREMKILRDDGGFVDKMACLSEPQPDVVSGHKLVSGTVDYTEPVETLPANDGLGRGVRFGEVVSISGDRKPSIRILEAGFYAICYCDDNCNEMLNWAVFGRVLIMGPLLNQNWVRYANVPFDIDLRGWNLNSENKINILSFSKTLADCSLEIQIDRAFGPEGKPTLLTEDSPNEADINGMAYHKDGTEISFSNYHGLSNDDYITLDQFDVRTQPYLTKMYVGTHKVFVACDDPPLTPNGCHKILIPVKFPAAEFPDQSLLNYGTAKWTRSSVEEFKKIKISLASPDGRGYIVCWSPSGDQTENYIGQAGTITVKEPLEMQAKLGLTTRMPVNRGAAGYGTAGAPVMIWFRTSDIAHYEQAAVGSMSIKIVIQPGIITTDNGDGTFTTTYEETLEFRDYLNKVLSPGSPNFAGSRESASQSFCGQMILELASEDEDGFPQPHGCFFDEDATQAASGGPTLQQLHIVFSPTNHLKRNTVYYVVMNMNIFDNLASDFPADAPIHVWSMDAYEVSPYGVVEKGIAYPSPEKHVPPRNDKGELVLTDFNTDDPVFDPDEGFVVLSPGGSDENQIIEVFTYCLGENVQDPANSPPAEKQCLKCDSEEFCGNYDPQKTWCVSPIDRNCVDGDPVSEEMFQFRVKAAPGHKVTNRQHIRLWFHPLTQWNMVANCQGTVNWAPGGCTITPGTCQALRCSAEAVLLTTVEPPSEYPINSMKLSFQVMDDIKGGVMHTIAVGSNRVPHYGFYPHRVTAELMKDDDSAPNYWGVQNQAPKSGYLYKQPKVVSAAIVTYEGDGNLKPFKGQADNRLYIRFVMGATLFMGEQSAPILIRLKLPYYQPNPAFGYKCVSAKGTSEVAHLNYLEGKVPSGKGKLGGGDSETRWDAPEAPPSCDLFFLHMMVLYAKSVVYYEIAVDNPREALNRDDPTNFYDLVVQDQFWGLQAPIFRVGSPLPGLGGSVSVLGKLSEMIIAPTNWGVYQENWLSIFFKTEQEVGSMMIAEAEVWIDAPSDFNFQLACAVKELAPNYHIPEADPETYKLPLGAPPICNGGTNLNQGDSAMVGLNERVYNRAMVRTAGRLLAETLYGFQLEVRNAPIYIRNQQDGWRIWTYSTEGAGVDGAFNTIRYNQRDYVGGNTSFGIYPLMMPPENLQVEIEDMRPCPVGSGRDPTPITFYVRVQAVTTKPVRLIAPAGYEWAFKQSEFRYKKAGVGVNPAQVVEGVDADLPISGVPAQPISRPMNVLDMDYMAGSWNPGVLYGFVAKIRVPNIPPTASANQFTIEFGYTGTEEVARVEAGVFTAPLVKRLINGVVTYRSNVAATDSIIAFEFRTITFIERSGGIMIIGPPNFVFDHNCIGYPEIKPCTCQPKPAPGYPELPYDSDCLFEATAATGTPEITIVAGESGIPPARYKFTIDMTLPGVATVDPGVWTINTYSVLSPKPSQRVILDDPTTIPGFTTNVQMPYANMKSAMPDWIHCFFPTEEMLAVNPSLETNCAEENFQFYQAETGGQRNDQPGAQSAVIVVFQLRDDADGTGDILLRAPTGYEFNAECGAVVDSARIFNANAVPGSTPPLSFAQKYISWPSKAELISCKGKGNQARLRVREGLRAQSRYIFRVSVLKNPMQTPAFNYFALEYMGESSELFEGVEIWAFQDVSLVPLTTAASLSWMPIKNLVTMTLRPVNPVGCGMEPNPKVCGMIRVKAPEGFLIRGDTRETITQCHVSLKIHHTEMPNITAQPPGQLRQEMRRWAEFFSPQDVECKGDDTPSSRARLIFHDTDGLKYLKPKVWYVFELMVWNPEVTDAVGQPWEIVSYRDTSLNNPIDSVFIPGFPINDAIEQFSYMKPSSYNALMYQQIDFNMTFPDTVEIGDFIEIVAPVTYLFSLMGDSRCPGYLYLTGSLQRSVPSCMANSMSWVLEEETVPANTVVRFLVQVQNPAVTPSPDSANEFKVRIKAPDLTVKSSRMIKGYSIVPAPTNVRVILCPGDENCNSAFIPQYSCRPVVDLLPQGYPCEAAGSRSAVRVFFFPTMSANYIGIRGSVLSGDQSNPFDFSDTVASGDNVESFVPGASRIVVKRPCKEDVEAFLTIDGIQNPDAPGVARFTISTYSKASATDDDRRDEKLDFVAYNVLGYIQTLESSTVNPIYYSSLGATVTFDLRPHTLWEFADVVRVTRPVGYSFVDKSLKTFGNFRVGEHGWDDLRKWSNEWQNPPDYWMVLDFPVQPLEQVTFSLKADLPQGQEARMEWFFKAYHVEPEYDPVDGEIIDESQVPYPWLGRDITLYASNDGAFSGFLLVGGIQFTVVPQRKTPGAFIDLTINFQLPAPVDQATYSLILDVTAPAGYVFADSCLKGSRLQFSKCSGFRNTASLTTVIPELSAAPMAVGLAVTNPGETPLPNTWTLKLFMDRELGNTQYVNYNAEPGYEIEAMRVSYKGNNQLAESATGFFTFTPMSKSPGAKIYMVFYPPPDQGFNLNCEDVRPLAFRDVNQCESEGTNTPLTLRFDNATILAEVSYTIGIGVSNPGGIKDDNAKWGLLLQDHNLNTFDGDLRIPGLFLKSVPIMCGMLGWTTAEPRELSVIQIQMRVTSTMAPGLVKVLEVQAPSGIMYIEDTSKVQISPTPLPLATASPVQILGDTLRWNLDLSQEIIQGQYNLRFEVSNPGVYPSDNTWRLRVMKDIEVEFSHVFTGYTQGQTSPFEVMAAAATAGTGAARRQSALSTPAVVIAMAVGTFALYASVTAGHA